MHRASRSPTLGDYFERINHEVCVIAQIHALASDVPMDGTASERQSSPGGAG
ncbi:MAG: hypothetical protein ACK4XK_09955 [Casimicrobiaceae bacterium]